MTKEKCAVLVYHDFYEHLEDLTFEQKGKLFDAILEYDMRGEISVELDSVSSMAFKFIKAAIDRDKEAYQKKCKKNAENASKGGRPKKETPEINQSVFNETQENPNGKNKPNGFFQNQSVNLETQKTERFFSKPKKPDKDNDNDNDTEKGNDKTPLPIEGVAGGENNKSFVVKISGRKAGQVFSSFLNRVRGKIPDEHIENCYLSLVDVIKDDPGLLRCVDDWLLTVFNHGGKTNFPAKSLVEYARGNFQKYKPPKNMVPSVNSTKEMLQKQAENSRNAVSPLEYSRDEALKWVKNLPDFWRKKSKIALKLLDRFNFEDEELKK